jgi:hypothetical protein
MPPNELQGLEKLVCFFLQQTKFVVPVKNNRPFICGTMWVAGDWWKGSKKLRFWKMFLVKQMAGMIKRSQYNSKHKESVL